MIPENVEENVERKFAEGSAFVVCDVIGCDSSAECFGHFVVETFLFFGQHIRNLFNNVIDYRATKFGNLLVR